MAVLPRGARAIPLEVFACAALIGLGAVLKLGLAPHGPLWLDEGWTLGVVDRPTAAGFLEQLRLDVNPPLYFVLMRGWTTLAGLGDAALRAPSTLLATAAVLPPLLAGRALPQRDRWAWAAVLGLLPDPVYFAQEARGYALLLALEAGAAVAFLRVLEAPGLARAALWCGLSSLAMLTHHYALPLAAAQGVTLLAVHRRDAVRLWPAALLFAPALAWLALQAPRLAVFARPAFAWYARLTWADAPKLADALAGAPLAWAALWLLAAGLRLTARRSEGGPPRLAVPATLAALTSVGVAAGLVALGVLRPSFTPRYLAPELPGVALALVLALRAAAPVGARWPQAGFAACVGAAALWNALHADEAGRRAYQIETASSQLGAAGVRRLAFLWDNPTDGALAPAERAALADAFFVRAGRRLQVVGVRPAPGADPNPLLAAAPADAVLWLYDRRVPRTVAVRFPPRLETVDGRLSCRRYAGGALGVVACVRAPLRWTT